MATKLVDALEKALDDLARQPRVGSPTLGYELGVAGMRTWRIAGLPLSFWHFEGEAHVDVARLVGHRQDALEIDIEQT